MSVAAKLGRKKCQWGLTLLEVLVSISLICTVMISFAMVYPASFRLTRKTSLANQAASYAASVADELRTKAVFGKLGSRNSLYAQGSGSFLEDYLGSDTQPDSRKPLSANAMVAMHFPKISIPEPFTLINGSNTGVVVSCSYKEQVDGAGVKYYEPLFWTISVTVYWTETDPKGKLQQRSSTIVTSKATAVLSRD